MTFRVSPISKDAVTAKPRKPKPRPAHRPRQDPDAVRVKKSYRLHPDTIAAIEDESERSGNSQGQVVDRLAAGLKKPG